MWRRSFLVKEYVAPYRRFNLPKMKCISSDFVPRLIHKKVSCIQHCGREKCYAYYFIFLLNFISTDDSELVVGLSGSGGSILQ